MTSSIDERTSTTVKNDESLKEGPDSPDADPAPQQSAARGWRFWAIFPPLCIATLFLALESTVTSTSLPEITAELNSGSNYVWILNGYLLTA